MIFAAREKSQHWDWALRISAKLINLNLALAHIRAIWIHLKLKHNVLLWMFILAKSCNVFGIYNGIYDTQPPTHTHTQNPTPAFPLLTPLFL